MRPVILSVFANDEERFLQLDEERKVLESIFPNNNRVSLIDITDATPERIQAKITDKELRQRIVIFHFAGHSGPNHIRLSDGQGNATGIAKMIAMLPNLQMVFLNGCDNYEQSKLLLLLGIKVVITTLRPLEDRIAIDFAGSFYNAINKYNTFDDAFLFAQSFIQTKYDHGPLVFGRGFGEEDDDNGENTYVISASQNAFLKNILLENIPDAQEYWAGRNCVDYVPNRSLLTTIASSIINGNYGTDAAEIGSIRAAYDTCAREPNHGNFNKLSLNLLPVLPYPVSTHIQSLTSFGTGYDRNYNNKVSLLSKQILTYDSLVKLLSFTLLSCLWREIERNEHLEISPGQRAILKIFLSSSELNSQDINYPAVLLTISDILANNSLNPFISEFNLLAGIFEDPQEFYDAHLHMQGMKSCIKSGEINNMPINCICQETEDILCRIFSRSGFIVRYKLTTIKNIEFKKSRLKKPSYLISRTILDGYNIIAADIVPYDTFTDSHSVILAKGLANGTVIDFLSLSPFIIDRNFLMGEDLAMLFFYSHSNENSYVYRWAEDPSKTLTVLEESTYENIVTKPEIQPKTRIQIMEINLRMSEIKKEMDAFKTLINHSSDNGTNR